MDKKFEEMIEELVGGYRTRCPEDAKLLEDAVKSGDTVSMYSTLLKNANQPLLSRNEKLLHFTRLFYYIGYCIKYDNGIPMLKVLSDWIDNNNNKRKVTNAVMSLSNLFQVLIEKHVDIKILADYIYEREMIEYATDEERKSTGVLKRILERKKVTQNEEIYAKPNTMDTSKEKQHPKKETASKPKLQNGYSSKEWCTILYFSDYLEKNETEYDTDIVKSFHAKHKLPFAETAFLQNFKEVKRHIDKSEKQAVKLIKKIIPYFSKDKSAQNYAENQLSIIMDDLDRK